MSLTPRTEEPLKETLTLPSNTLIFLRGQPTSGKTSLLEAAKRDYLFKIIDPDITRAEPAEFEEYVRRRVKDDKEFTGLDIRTQLYRFHIDMCIKALQDGEAVVWAQPWSVIEGVDLTIETMRERISPELVIAVVELIIPDDVARQRVIERADHPLTIGDYDSHFRGRFETIGQPPDDAPYAHILLGANSAEYNLRAFLQLLSDLYSLKSKSAGTDC
jgi:hypothetical protein